VARDARPRVSAWLRSSTDSLFSHAGAESVLDAVDSLIEKSLLQVSTDVLDKSALYGQEEEPRLSMLETIREYALECLAANGEL